MTIFLYRKSVARFLDSYCCISISTSLFQHPVNGEVSWKEGVTQQDISAIQSISIERSSASSLTPLAL
jgi:hypothetical protein